MGEGGEAHLHREHHAHHSKDEGWPATAAEEGKEGQPQVILRPGSCSGNLMKQNSRLLQL